eukprot:1380620-Amorphochlora_amoeboformis.AAC.2
MVYGVWCMVYRVWCIVYGVCGTLDLSALSKALESLSIGISPERRTTGPVISRVTCCHVLSRGVTCCHVSHFTFHVLTSFGIPCNSVWVVWFGWFGLGGSVLGGSVWMVRFGWFGWFDSVVSVVLMVDVGLMLD